MLSVAIDNQVPLLQEEAVEQIGQVESCRECEVASGTLCDLGNVNSPRRELSEEEHVVRDQAPGPSDFDREQVGSGQRLPVSFQEGARRSPLYLAILKQVEGATAVFVGNASSSHNPRMHRSGIGAARLLRSPTLTPNPVILNVT